ncbi:hypothetical protein HK100_010186, partial [Physocladia obscura]
MEQTELKLEEMSGFVDFTKYPNPPVLRNALEEARLRVPDGGGLFQIQFGPSKFVRFRVVKKLSSNKTGSATSYVARELNSGLFAQKLVLDEQSQLDEDEAEDELSTDNDADNDENENENNKKSALQRQFILSVESPQSAWEFYVLKTLRNRCSEDRVRILTSIPNPVSCHLFADASCMRHEYCSEFSLYDAIAASSRAYGSGLGGGIEEILAAFWTIEAMRTIEAVHLAGFLHGAVNVRNIYVRLQQSVNMIGGPGHWDSKYDATGRNGWSLKGVSVQEWKQAIDLFAFPVEQNFLFDSESSQCWECVNGIPCKYEPDWFGVASVVHWMLFGKEIVVVSENIEGRTRPKFKVANKFMRSWQVSLWERLFDVLLNLENADGSVIENGTVDVASFMNDEEFADFASEFPPAIQLRAL